ncbi:ABC-type transport auxiliary lipoprotein family protein [Sphingomonas profundi]|uniref:ABC-type transport auxiliary lipoprotein family protein n=1 Tax=Alterirhizorhabdus profundi TaxID=2681549 RepID=UPI0012E944A5|nr:ABC-type transport auxiliary lipoprotein family protein [Sphingomonas profundi]
MSPRSLPLRSVLRHAAILGAALPLAACISFGAKPPAQLLALTADSVPASGAARTARDGETVIVYVPTVPQELSTARVPVRAGPTSVAYLKDAQWVDAPNRLFRDVLAQTLAARSSRVVLDPRQAALAPGMRLGGRLIAFGLDAPTNNAVAIYEATLARGEKRPVETRRFEARVPVSAQTVAAVAPALNQAANQIASEVTGWVG